MRTRQKTKNISVNSLASSVSKLFRERFLLQFDLWSRCSRHAGWMRHLLQQNFKYRSTDLPFPQERKKPSLMLKVQFVLLFVFCKGSSAVKHQRNLILSNSLWVRPCEHRGCIRLYAISQQNCDCKIVRAGTVTKSMECNQLKTEFQAQNMSDISENLQVSVVTSSYHTIFNPSPSVSTLLHSPNVKPVDTVDRVCVQDNRMCRPGLGPAAGWDAAYRTAARQSVFLV